MSTNKGFSLAGLISRFTACFKRNETKQEQQPFELNDCRNPWQHNLERLAATQHSFVTPEKAETTDSLTSFVTDLAKKTLEMETHKTDAQKAEAQKTTQGLKRVERRTGDKTINDMKSWWQDSLSPDDASQHGNVNYSELPGKPRLLKRWFE